MYWKCSNPNCHGNRRDKVAPRTTCIKNVKFKIIEIRTGCQYVDTFTTTKPNGQCQTFDWATCGPRVGHSWPSSGMSASKKRTSVTFANLQACQHARNFGLFSYASACIDSFCCIYVGWWEQPTLISENNQSVEQHSLKTKNVSFFEDTKNRPTIITLLRLNHHIDFRCD